MTASALSEIRNIVQALHFLLIAVKSPARRAFFEHAQDLVFEQSLMADLIERSTPNLRFEFASVIRSQIPMPELLMHGISDPIRKILSLLNLRADDVADGVFRGKATDIVLAQSFFYLEKLEQGYRDLFCIEETKPNAAREDHEDAFADLLNHMRFTALPRIKDLIPQALQECGFSPEHYDEARRRIIADFPEKTRGVSLLGPRREQKFIDYADIKRRPAARPGSSVRGEPQQPVHP